MSDFEYDEEDDWGFNVYSSPHKLGLTPLGEIDWSSVMYQFDLTVFWTDEAGALYWGSDSGCSCPSPFEDHTELKDLNTGSQWEAVEYLKQRYAGMVGDDWRDGEYFETWGMKVANLMAKLAAP